MSSIPDVELIGETVEGTVYSIPEGVVLALGTPPPLDKAQCLAQGTLIVRYGLTLQVPATEIVIPGLFAAERGGFLTGREAWDFILRNFQLYPRADVVGLRLNGQKAQHFLREIDFGVPPRAYLYIGPDEKVPLAEANWLAVGSDAPPIPDLLAQYVPRFEDRSMP